MSGEGRGRVAFNDEKYSFEFESLLKLKKHTWMIGVQIPFRGEELLTINYITKVLKLNNKMIKINYNHLDKLNKRKLLALFIDKLISFFNLYEELNKKTSATRSGKHEGNTWKYQQGKLNFIFPIDKNLSMKVTFSELNNSYYHKISWELSDKNNYKFHQYPFKLNLYLERCATR